MQTMPRGMVLDLPATMHPEGFTGGRGYCICIIGEAVEHYRFRALEAIPMPSGKWIAKGAIGRVLKTAVKHRIQNTAPAGCRQQSGVSTRSTAH